MRYKKSHGSKRLYIYYKIKNKFESIQNSHRFRKITKKV